MRLINARTLKLEEFRGRRPPRYAIVSHRWEDDEVTYNDFQRSEIEQRKGFYKLDGACRKALQNECEWVWFDTCCIDKSSSSELTEAINSMFNWYKAAYICLVYLYDFGGDAGNGYFENCEWFTRGWTLQELIAPSNVVFFDRDWRFVGRKTELSGRLAATTGIDVAVLRGADPTRFSVAQRMSWAAQRETTQIEDRAYCLLGLFNVTMPMLYGEGERAFLKLQEEIMKYSNDHTIFAWDRCFPRGGRSGLLAHKPACFAACQDIVHIERLDGTPQGFSMTNIGLSISLATIPYTMHTYLAILDCSHSRQLDFRYGILLERLSANDQYARVRVGDRSVVSIHRDTHEPVFTDTRPLLIRQMQYHAPRAQHCAFWIRSLALPGYRRSQLAEAELFSRDRYIGPNDGLGVLKIPNSYFGTAGVIKLWPDDKDTPWWRVEYLALGYDKNFMPCCLLGNAGLRKKSHPFVEAIVNKRNKNLQRFNSDDLNSWIGREKLDSYRGGFQRNCCCVLKIGQKEKKVDYLNLSLSLELVPVPETLQCLRPSPWSVWAVDIRLGNGLSPQALANRDVWVKGSSSAKKVVTESLPRWSGKALLASIGAEALGGDGLSGLGDMLGEV